MQEKIKKFNIKWKGNGKKKKEVKRRKMRRMIMIW
jgi:hypothetical protein